MTEANHRRKPKLEPNMLYKQPSSEAVLGKLQEKKKKKKRNR